MEKRCTIQWIQFGDENRKCFQDAATKRYRKNYMANLKSSDGSVVDNNASKESILFSALTQCLGTASTPAMCVVLHNLINPDHDLDQLILPFTHVEIDLVVIEMPYDKGPSPNGFNRAFLKACWHIIQFDIYKLCEGFHEGKLNLESLNSGYITLIPKCNSP